MNESDTDSESEVEMEKKIQRVPKPKPILKKAEAKAKTSAAGGKNDDDDDDDDEEEDEESDIALSDLDEMADSDREDLYVKTKLSINNGPALLASLKRIAIARDAGAVPFSAHQVVVSSEPTAPKIDDISDDLNRELQLYAQSLEAAKRARALLRAEGVPFSRPKDYFAEMVKDDGHMEKVKAKLVEAATNKKAAAEARKLRDLKKFGKQVQVAKLQERHKQKRETLEKIKALKKSKSIPPPPPTFLLIYEPEYTFADKIPPLHHRALRERQRAHHQRGRPLRRRRRQRAQQARQALAGRRSGRPRTQHQARQEGLQVRFRRQEEVLQVRRRRQLGRPEQLQRQEDEGAGRRRWRRRRSWRKEEVCQDGAAGQE